MIRKVGTMCVYSFTYGIVNDLNKISYETVYVFKSELVSVSSYLVL